MDGQRLEYLFDRYLTQNCSKEEERELMSLLAQPSNEEKIQLLIEQAIERTEAEIKMPNDVAASILENIVQKDKRRISYQNDTRKINLTRWKRIAIAATVVLFMVGTLYWFDNNKKDSIGPIALQKTNPSIIPGSDKALLTRSDGTTIILDSTKDGLLQKSDVKINKHGGLLIYDRSASSNAPIENIVYNTLSTPRGGQFRVVLPDGTKVWLNASSSLYFPSAFDGDDRKVVLTGEAYFEVAKNKEKPFHVQIGTIEVNVLGTHFNINAYEDESSIRTSLLEGSIELVNDKQANRLVPGQQAVLNKKENNLVIKNTDMSEVIAWKNGLFQFEEANIKTIMRQIGRWYDVDITYVGKAPAQRFEGKISRDAPLSDVLKILELSGARFAVEGKKIIVQ